MSGFRIWRIGGDDRIRTGDGGFADPCLTTWLRRPGARLPDETASARRDQGGRYAAHMLVPRRRFELLRLAARPPQDRVSAYSTTSARPPYYTGSPWERPSRAAAAPKLRRQVAVGRGLRRLRLRRRRGAVAHVLADGHRHERRKLAALRVLDDEPQRVDARRQVRRVPQPEPAAGLAVGGAQQHRPGVRRVAGAELQPVGDEVRRVRLAGDLHDALDVRVVLRRVEAHGRVAGALLSGHDADVEDARPLARLALREVAEAVGHDEGAALLHELRRGQLRREQAVADVDLRGAPPVVVLLRRVVLRHDRLDHATARRRGLEHRRLADVDVGDVRRAFEVARGRIGEGGLHEVAHGAIRDRGRGDVVHRRVIGVAGPDAGDEVGRVAVGPRFADGARVLVRLAGAGLHAPGAADAQGAAAVGQAEGVGVGEDVVDHVGVAGVDHAVFLDLDAVVLGGGIEDAAVLAGDLEDGHGVERAVAGLVRASGAVDAAHDAAAREHGVGVRDVVELDIDEIGRA